MKLRRLFSIVCVSLLLWGCAGEEETASVPVKPKSKPAATQKATDKATVAEAKPVEDYVYDPIGKRDPFRSPLGAGIFAPDESEAPLTPLQQYEITQLQLSGVVLGMQAPKAMVKAPDGKAYILNIGTLVGKNGGKVIKIDNEGVWVEEILRDFSGQTRVNSVLISLPKRKGV